MLVKILEILFCCISKYFIQSSIIHYETIKHIFPKSTYKISYICVFKGVTMATNKKAVV